MGVDDLMRIAWTAMTLGLALIGAPHVVRGQANVKDDDPRKVSNDTPDRPLQMPPASSEAKEAFDDFDRFARRGVWERATKALQSIGDDQSGRFVDGEANFIITVARKRRAVLAGLAPEGRAAYRLFYDADARKLLDAATGPAELANLERIVASYSLTSVGDDAADRLGDVQFEAGRFDRAADLWLSVFRDQPETDLSLATVGVKAAVALARAGRTSEAEALRGELADRFADEPVILAGRKAKPADHLAAILGPARTTAALADATGPVLAPTDSVGPAWQVRFGQSVTAGMSPADLIQWETNPLAGAVPAVAIDGSRLFVNYVGYVVAFDLATGKALWRSGAFHNLEVIARQDQVRMLDLGRFATLAADGSVWTLGRDLREMNPQAPFRLVRRRAEAGEVVWQSADLPEYNEFDIVGTPLMAGGAIYLAARTSTQRQQNQPHQYVVAIRPSDGKVLWKAEVGTFRQGQQQYSYYGMSDTTPKPRLAYRAGAVYIDTHSGLVVRVDGETGAVDWGYGYPTDPANSMSRIFYRYSNDEPTTRAEPPLPLATGDALLVKGAKSGYLSAIDPDRMKPIWDRPIAKSARVIGADAASIYLGGPELGAIDLKTRALRWSTGLPGGSESAQALVRPDGIWQLTPRGVFEVEPATGKVRRIFRGADPGSSGGDLILTDRWLVAVTNQAITAYPRASAPAVARGSAGPDARGSDE